MIKGDISSIFAHPAFTPLYQQHGVCPLQAWQCIEGGSLQVHHCLPIQIYDICFGSPISKEYFSYSRKEGLGEASSILRRFPEKGRNLPPSAGRNVVPKRPVVGLTSHFLRNKGKLNQATTIHHQPKSLKVELGKTKHNTPTKFLKSELVLPKMKKIIISMSQHLPTMPFFSGLVFLKSPASRLAGLVAFFGVES